jgi:hypothetical protein
VLFLDEFTEFRRDAIEGPRDRPTLRQVGATLRGKDLCREVERRTHDEAIAIAHREHTRPIAVVRMDALGVTTRRAEGRGGILLVG